MQTIIEQNYDLVQEEAFKIPIVSRGRLITDYSDLYGGRHGLAKFTCPNPQKYLKKIVLDNPDKMKDLYSIGLDDIITFLHDFGERLDLKTNEHLQEAYSLGCDVSGLTAPVLKSTYDLLPVFFSRNNIKEMIEHRIGSKYLESWVPEKMEDGRTIYLRAFGARTIHIIAGNVPLVAAGTIIRSSVTRSDAIIKLPSNDPLTATALARTMFEMDPNHPITKHLTVAYWKGGTTSFEEMIYRPEYIEKIVAWGGFNSIKHITRYLQPGIDLITLDPKISTSIIGKEAFRNIATLKKVAQRAAIDIGSYNQEACVNSRVIYVESGTNARGIKKLNKFASLLYKAIVGLPDHVSTPAKDFDPELKILIDGLRLNNDYYRVYGGKNNEGCVIASQFGEPVDFSMRLCGRVVNLVPIDDLQFAVKSVNSYTQTVGIYPEKLKSHLRDDLVRHGVQRIVSLGFAAVGSLATPQDALEPLRRMCKWVVDESSTRI